MTKPNYTNAAEMERNLRRHMKSGNTKALVHQLVMIRISGIRPLSWLPLFQELLEKRRNDDIIRHTCVIVEDYGSKAERCLPRLIELSDRCIAPIDAVWAITKDCRLVLPQMGRYVERFPEEACDLICQIGPDAADLVPHIIKVLGRDDWDEMWAAVDALGAIGPKASVALPILRKLRKHKSGVISSRATIAIASIAQGNEI